MIDTLVLAQQTRPDFAWRLTWDAASKRNCLEGSDYERGVRVSLFWSPSDTPESLVERAIRELRRAKPLDGRGAVSRSPKAPAGQMPLVFAEVSS